MRAANSAAPLVSAASPSSARSRWLGGLALTVSSGVLAPAVGGLPWWGSTFLMSPASSDWMAALAAVYMMAFVPALAGGVLFAFMLPALVAGRVGRPMSRAMAQALSGLCAGLLGGVVCGLFFAVDAVGQTVGWCAFVGLLLGLLFPARVARWMRLLP
jgi:hypothetical protein